MKSKSIYNRRLETHFLRLLAQALERKRSTLAAPITVSRINLTSDLRIARVYFTTDGLTISPAITVALNDSAKTLKMDIARSWKYRFLPDVVFCPDQELINADKVSILLDKSSTSESDSRE